LLIKKIQSTKIKVPAYRISLIDLSLYSKKAVKMNQEIMIIIACRNRNRDDEPKTKDKKKRFEVVIIVIIGNYGKP